MAVDNKKIAEEVLAAVGGKDNVSTVTHCATRLRFNLKDAGIPKEDEVKRISGVIGVMQAGGQYQIVIGQNVEKVYEYVCALGNFKREKAIDEVLDQGLIDQKWTPKRVVDNILNYIISSMTPVINILMGVALWNVVGALLPQFGVIPADHPLVTTCSMIFNALMYFIPIYIGYGAAKALKISNPVWGMVIGGLTIVPTFVSMAATTDTFQLFGFLSVPVSDYGQSVIPVLLGVFVFKYLYDLLKKVVPDIISSMVISFVAFFVMPILMFKFFCPIGTIFGNVISNVFMAMSSSSWPVRLIAYVALSATWTLITLCGMHLPIFFATVALYGQIGCDPFAMACIFAGLMSLNGMSIAAIFKFKKSENKSTAVSATISGCIGGISEPALYSVGMRNKRTLLIMILSGAATGVVAAILQPVCYTIVASGALFNLVTPWAGGPTSNIIRGVAMDIAGLLFGFFGIMLFGKMDEDEE